MKRIAGVDLPNDKRVDVALTYIYGIGRKNVVNLLEKARVEESKRIKQLTEEEVKNIQKVIEGKFKVEGDLRGETLEAIKRLKQIGSYRGVRHVQNLPVRGQRSKTNARTRKGPRKPMRA